MKPKTVDQLVFEMLTTNTGRHMLDSGGAYGRNWERNQKLSIEKLKKRPEATLEIRVCEDGSVECNPTVDLFHKLTGSLDLDTLCHEFNSLPVEDWESNIYGVSSAGEAWLKERFDLSKEAFNTYNWSNNFSQVIQGQEVECLETGDTYVLIQVHGGCDVRVGYTDAKLFKCEDISDVLSDDCMFDVIDWMGEFINHEGRCATDEDFKKLVKKYRIRKGQTKTIKGSIVERY